MSRWGHEIVFFLQRLAWRDINVWERTIRAPWFPSEGFLVCLFVIWTCVEQQLPRILAASPSLHTAAFAVAGFPCRIVSSNCERCCQCLVLPLRFLARENYFVYQFVKNTRPCSFYACCSATASIAVNRFVHLESWTSNTRIFGRFSSSFKNVQIHTRTFFDLLYLNVKRQCVSLVSTPFSLTALW